MPDISNIKFKLSGGASNTNPANSLGGAISNAIIPPQTTTVASNTTGLSVTYAHSNPLGSGTLHYYAPIAAVSAKPQITVLTATIGAGSSLSDTLVDKNSSTVQFTLTIGGRTYTEPTTYGQAVTRAQLLSNLATKINTDSAAVVTAVAASTTLTLTSKTNAAFTYAISAYSNYDTFIFSSVTNGYSCTYTIPANASYGSAWTVTLLQTQAAAAAVAGDSQAYLSWQPLGDAGGSKVPVAINTAYALAAATTGALLVSTPATLPTADANISVTIAIPYGSLFDDIAGIESLQGNTDYRCFYVKNEDSSTHSAIKLWCSQQPVGDDVIQLGFAAATGVNDIAVSIDNDTTAPAGVSFVATNSEATALNIGTLAAGEYIAVWQKRSITAATRAAVADNFELTLSAL
ncbi:MAG: hypothetical protein PHP00_06925 [Thiotrichaceae bacterium]|nr:hypothetical protein [Thiotrichaceae bacterium]